MPMFPAAPGRFSISTGWPHIAVSFSPRRRGIRSEAPPGANGTITRTGFCGQDCACATETASRRGRISKRVMNGPLLDDLGGGALERDRVELAGIRVVASGDQRFVCHLKIS